MKPKPEGYSEEETARRALDLIRRSFALPHKTVEDFKGKTPRAKAMARKRRRKAKGPKAP
jgi:hypothetical protein